MFKHDSLRRRPWDRPLDSSVEAFCIARIGCPFCLLQIAQGGCPLILRMELLAVDPLP